MSEMIDRIALALARENCSQSAEAARTWEHYRDDARIAIEVMREPTRAMIDAVDLSVPTEGMITGIWGTMIDEALK